MRTLTLTAVAMLAFAANSLLCRLALGDTGTGPAIDPASFTTLRLGAGALVLWLIAYTRTGKTPLRNPDWLAAAMLFLYAAAFSFAYLWLGAGTGALILFGAVQLTMFAVGLHAGEPFARLSWVGFVLAVAGLAYLVSPGLTAPSPLGAALMAGAGIAWGVYSLRGRGVADPLGVTAGNFLRSLPFTFVISALSFRQVNVSVPGIALAVTSGAVTSGLGYVIWYAALRGLNATRAATVQLSVPPIAAVGAVLLLAEPITWRLALASVAILGGIALVLMQRSGAVAGDGHSMNAGTR